MLSQHCLIDGGVVTLACTGATTTKYDTNNKLAAMMFLMFILHSPFDSINSYQYLTFASINFLRNILLYFYPRLRCIGFMSRQLLLFGLIATLSLQLANASRACGPEWITADEIGYGFYSQTLATLTVGKESIPLTLQFTPLTVTNAQLFGPAWQAPLLESRVIAEPATVSVHAPDGSAQTFTPSEKNPNLYTNPNGWAGEKKEDTFIIHSGCGWRITYRAGVITELKTKENLTLKWNYTNARLVSITSGTNTLVQLTYHADGHLQSLSADREHCSFAYAKSSKDQTAPLLTSIIWKNSGQERYIYLVKPAHRAALKIITRSNLTLGREWDTKTNSLLSSEPQ